MRLLAGVAAALVLVLAVAGYAAWMSSRLDRLSGRVASSWAALDVQLVGRAAAAAALARRSGDDELAQAADDALSDPADREGAENALSRAIRRVQADPDGALTAACGKVRLARQFHNDAVRDLRSLRGRLQVRLLRVARRPAPPFFEFDDGAEPVPAAAVRDDPATRTSPP